jgi:signal transduction histidine kinase
MSVSGARLIRSRSFRLGLLYLCALNGAALLLLGVVYWSTTAAVTRQIETTINAEILGLSEQFNQRGIIGLNQAIQRRVQQDESRRALYLLTDAAYQPLAGNLDRWPSEEPNKDGWVTFGMTKPAGDGDGLNIGWARVFDLGGRYHLLVGHDIRERSYVEGLIRETLAWGLGGTLVLTLIGGFLLARLLLRQIDVINTTSRDIMAGDISRRIPVQGSGDEFDELSENLNAMLDQIERLVRGLKEVSDNIAHDLRSPLARLRSRLELALLEPADAERYKDVLLDTIAEADSLLATFNALLSIAEAEAGTARDQFVPLDLEGLLSDVAELYEPLAEAAELSFGFACDRDALRLKVMGDRDLLFQALANLLDNAIKFSDPGGAVTLSLKRRGDRLDITVADRGPGVPAAARGKVMERFYRLEESRTTPGSGLGLSMVAAVARLHDGELSLSDNGPGLRATIALPIRERNGAGK